MNGRRYVKRKRINQNNKIITETEKKKKKRI